MLLDNTELAYNNTNLSQRTSRATRANSINKSHAQILTLPFTAIQHVFKQRGQSARIEITLLKHSTN